MTFSKRFANHNYHAKGLSLREILMKRPCQTFMIELYSQKNFIVNTCLSWSSLLARCRDVVVITGAQLYSTEV